MSESSEKPPQLIASAVNEGSVPKVDMIFETDEKAYQFYCLYAKEMGFGVRKHFVKRRSSGHVYSRVFCCYKEGFCRTGKEAKKQRQDTRTGCQAHLNVRVMDDGRYCVTRFEANHNHELVPESPEPVTEQTVQQAAKKKMSGRPTLKPYFPPKDARFVKKTTQEEQSDNPIQDCVPRVDMEFENDEEAYGFYVSYASSIGFSVRKHLVKKRASGLVYSRTYCCHKEGHSRKSGEEQMQKPKPYDRTGCLASMTIKITKNGRYCVTDFEEKHNHVLVIPAKAHLFRWQWRRSLTKRPHNDLVNLVSSPTNLQEDGHVPIFSEVSENYSTMVGDVGAILQYMQEKQTEDPSFYYALQLDQENRLTNVFWTDGKSKADFDYFSDVICLDTTYRAHEYGRPFVLFIGVNHHKRAIVLGQALLYSETEESLKWLLEAFKSSMSGRQPRVVLTDRSKAISNAVAEVWPGTAHRFCVWQLYKNAEKHLYFVFHASMTFAKDLSKVLYEIEEEEQFLREWESLLVTYDLKSNMWLAKLYEDREKWSMAYGRQTFCGDMKTTLVKENMFVSLKEYLDSEKLFDFFKHYENSVYERRLEESHMDCRAHQSSVKIPSSRMLRQAANAYTPAVFKVFETEFELSFDCMVYNCGQVDSYVTYKVTIENLSIEYIVKFDTSEGKIFCSCRKFEYTGIQCRHVLKVLDIINIKELPSQYILKRWRKDAKSRNAGEVHGHGLNFDGKLSKVERYSSLCCLLNKVAVRAAETADSHIFVENLSDQLMDQLCRILLAMPPEKLED